MVITWLENSGGAHTYIVFIHSLLFFILFTCPFNKDLMSTYFGPGTGDSLVNKIPLLMEFTF